MLNKEKRNNLAGEIWKSAERLRGKFKAYEYQSVVLPIIVIRRHGYAVLEQAEISDREYYFAADHQDPHGWQGWRAATEKGLLWRDDRKDQAAVRDQ